MADSLEARIKELEVENADLRRAVPIISDGVVKWPSVHDNPTVLRALYFESQRALEEAEERLSPLLEVVERAGRLQFMDDEAEEVMADLRAAAAVAARGSIHAHTDGEQNG